MSFTVEKFANELGLPIDLLLDQLKSAGVKIDKPEDLLSEDDKSSLLEYLRSMRGGDQKPKSKITLTRKQNTEIKKTNVGGQARTIQVEVRKKRTLVKPEDNTKAPKEQNVSPKPIVDDNQKAMREDEARRHAALAEAQAADVKAKKDETKKNQDPHEGTLHRPASKVGVKSEKDKKDSKDDWAERGPKKKPSKLSKISLQRVGGRQRASINLGKIK